MAEQVLAGIRVADFAWQGVGPMTSRYLAHHGAEVIRVETTTHPDVQRSSWPFKDNIPGPNRAGYFNNFNTNKRGILLNLGHPQGVEVARRLVACSDIVTEAFSAGVMAKYGLAYEDLVKVKPDLIMVSMALMGQTGPHRRYRGHGMHLAAASGVGYLIGWPDRRPVGSPHAYTDFFVPHFAACALLAALDYRRRTGRGQYIDVSQFEVSIHALETAVLDYTVNGREQSRNGNRLIGLDAAPHGAYRCRGEDRWCTIAIFTDAEWRRFGAVIGAPVWAANARFATVGGRVRHADELDRLVESWTAPRTAEEVFHQLQGAGLDAGIVQSNQDIHRDPQLEHRGHFWRLEHPECGPSKYDGPSFRLSRTPAVVDRPAPLLGQHTQQVVTEVLGYSDDEFVAMLAAGAFE
ncbi:MAG: CoA transferase [Chloroflexi bacterium]|nr:CoA transferase [Chloroflexota bacterium]